MITFTLIFRKGSAEPLYKQLYDYIKSEIVCGNLNAGEKLPSKRRLASYIKVSQNTVETAYEQLSAEGYIKSVPKSGFYVCRLEGVMPTNHQDSAPLTESRGDEQSSRYKYDFETNTVDTTLFPFATWARISKEIMQNRGLLKTAHPQGDFCLRESIARYLHEFRGVNCLPEQIIIGAGTEYLVGLIIQILGRNNAYAVENPGYFKTYKILKCNNADVELVGLDEEGMSVRQLEDVGSNIVYVTPSHHFPLGVIMPVNRRMQLLKWANKDEDRYIIEDDYDSEFRFTGRPIPALQGLDDNKVIYISTFSKSIAPSIRISYMVLPPKLLDRYRNNFLFYSSTVSRFEQYTLYRFIKDGHFERHLNRMRNLYRARKDMLTEQIRKQLGNQIELIGENAGLHLLLKMNGTMKEKVLIDRAAKAGVKLYGLSEYYIQPVENMPEDIVILGYANFSLDQIVDAVSILKEAWLL